MRLRLILAQVGGRSFERIGVEPNGCLISQVGDDIGVPITLKQQMAGVTEATGGCNTGTMVWSAGR